MPKVLGFHWLLAIEQNNPRGSQNFQKKISFDFHPAFNTNKLLICKIFVNKVYAKLNCALNSVKTNL
jgi:hypothetical protein